MMLGFGFGIFNVLFTGMFVLVFGMIVATVFRGLATRRRNDNSPRLVVDAEVVAKRANVFRHRDMPIAGDATGAHGFHSMSDTVYYVTFEVRGGDRLEFAVDGAEYGQLVEGDRGELTFQGTRYVSFVRLISDPGD